MRAEFLFGEAELHELLGLLQLEVPPRLAALMQQRVPSRDATIIHGDTLTATLLFQPTSSELWLLDQHASGALSAVPYTLLCDVESRARQ